MSFYHRPNLCWRKTAGQALWYLQPGGSAMMGRTLKLGGGVSCTPRERVWVTHLLRRHGAPPLGCVTISGYGSSCHRLRELSPGVEKIFAFELYKCIVTSCLMLLCGYFNINGDVWFRNCAENKQRRRLTSATCQRRWNNRVVNMKNSTVAVLPGK